MIKFLELHFNLHGVPKRIRTDNDTAFTSKEFKHFCDQYNIERITGLPYMHTGTGLVERTIQSLKKPNPHKSGGRYWFNRKVLIAHYT